MEVTPDDTKNGEKSEKEPEVQSEEVVRVGSRKSSGDVPKRSEVTKSSASKAKVAQAPFANTRRQMRSLRRGMIKVWNLWSGFTKTSGSIPPKKKKKKPQTLGVPGFEEIACIDVDMPDIMMTDKDKIRTSCKQCVKNPPKFPTKEQVKSKLIAADKYYGVPRFTHKLNMNIERSGSIEHEADYYDEDGKIIRPNWRFILERPLVEQYVLMTNYIRKISILSELEEEHTQAVEEEEDAGSDSEYNKWTEKHKIDTENFLASLRAPRKKDTAVQTTMKPSEQLVEPVSETSLYPDSGSSNESFPSKEVSAVTIVTSRDFSSPLHSDLDNRSIVNSVRVKNAVKWWESKEPPQTSETFPTSSDSVRHISVTNRISSKVQNEPAKDTSGSGSDGMSIPVHNATGKTSLFKLNPTENNQSLGGRLRNEKQTNLAQDIPVTVEKGTTTQKKVTFSPVVEYYNAPERNNGIFSLPMEDEANNDTGKTSELEETKTQGLKETQNRLQNEKFFTLSPNQKHIVLQLGTIPKEGNKGFSIIQNNPVTESSGHSSMYFQQQYSNRHTSNTKKLQPETKIPLKPFKGVESGASSSEYRSTSPETVNAPSSSDYRSPPERMSEQLLTYGRYEQQIEENKESSSNSSERIELKPSPAVIFRPGDAKAIINMATDKFYPDVPDIDEVKNERSHQKGMYQEERRDICSFPVSTNREIAIEGLKPKSPPTSQGLANVVIVRGASPHIENIVNEISINNQQSNQRIKSLGVGRREEQDHLDHRSSKFDFDYSKSEGPELFHGTYTKIEDIGQSSHARQVSEAAAGTKQTSVYRSLLDDIHRVDCAPLDVDYRVPSKNRTGEGYPFIHPRNEQLENDESMIPETQQQRTTVYRELQKIPEMYNSTQFLSGQLGNAPKVSKAAAGTRQFSVHRTFLDDQHEADSTQPDMDYKDPSKNHKDNCQPTIHPRNTEQRRNCESMISRIQQERTTEYQELQITPEMYKSTQFLSFQLGDARQVSEATAGTRKSSVHTSLLNDLQKVDSMDMDYKEPSTNDIGECQPFTHPRNTEQLGNDVSMIPRTLQKRTTTYLELQKIPEIYNSTQRLSVQLGEDCQVSEAAAGTRQFSVHRSLLDDLHGLASSQLDIDYKDPLKINTGDCQSFIHPKNTEQQGNYECMIPRTQQQETSIVHQELQEIPEACNSNQFLSVELMKDCTIQSETGFGRSLTQEERSDLEIKTPCVDLHDRNIMRTGKQLKGTLRTSTITSTLTSDHIMRKISEELSYSSSEIRQDSPIPIRSGVHTESQEKVRDRCSYEDFCKFDVLKMSQIYSSSSSFVTSSEERMASGLNKFDGTLFQPIVVEEITPEVSMMPSKTDGSLISADRIMSTNNTTTDMNELEMNKCPSQGQRKAEQGINDPKPTQIQYSTQLVNKCVSQEQKRNVQEINFLTLTQIQYPTQLEFLTPCYTMIGNIQYSTQNEVEIMTEKIVSTVIPQVKIEEDTNNVIDSNIEYVLQKVQETIHGQATKPAECIHSAATNEDNISIVPKRWLTNVIPTVIKASKVSRQYSANPKIQVGGTSSPNPADVKPVFRYLKKQKETQNNE